MKKYLILVNGVGLIILGLLYVLRVWGALENEAIYWGKVSVISGVILVYTLFIFMKYNRKIIKTILIIELILIMLLQIPPVCLWIAFHGEKIVDWTYKTSFTAHWGYSMLHLAPFLIGIVTICQLCCKRREQ